MGDGIRAYTDQIFRKNLIISQGMINADKERMNELFDEKLCKMKFPVDFRFLIKNLFKFFPFKIDLIYDSLKFHDGWNGVSRKTWWNWWFSAISPAY